MRIVIEVEVELEHRSGKFASRDELTEMLVDELSGVDPGELEAQDGGIYAVTSWGVNT